MQLACVGRFEPFYYPFLSAFGLPAARRTHPKTPEGMRRAFSAGRAPRVSRDPTVIQVIPAVTRYLAAEARTVAAVWAVPRMGAAPALVLHRTQTARYSSWVT